MVHGEGERYAASTATPALQECPQLSRLHFFSARNQGLVADYLAHLRARHYAPAMQDATIRALNSFAVLMPAARQSTLYYDLTQTTPTDIDAWIEASCRRPLAPGTIATRLRVVQGFFAFLCDQGFLRQSPIRLPTITSSIPQDLPRPMAEDEVRAFFRVIDARRYCTRLLLMRWCGLRVGDVSRLDWSAVDLTQGTVRIDHSTGHVDRVVYLSPDVAKALRPWHRLQAAEAPSVFPSRVKRKGGTVLTARQIRNRMTRYLETCLDHEGLFTPHIAADVCHPVPQRGGLDRGRQSAGGAPLP